MYHHLTNYQPGAVIMAAAEIGLLDMLAGGPVPVAGLAERLDVSERGCAALCRGLQVLNVVAVTDHALVLTEEADPLVRTGAGGLARLIRKEQGFHRLWGNLATFVRAGRGHYPGWRERGLVDPETTEFFFQAINDIACGAAPDVLAAARLDGCTRIADVGGGGGQFARSIADSLPGAMVTIVELAATAPISRKLTSDHERITVLEGDASLPGLGGDHGDFDAVFVSHILHDTNREEARSVVLNCAAAVKPGGVLVINDTMTDDDPMTTPLITMFDVMMVVETPDGICHRRADVHAWLAEAGMTDIEETPLYFGSVIRSIRPN
jgi:2-polyprenyl-3-methyl-5-hydroxy-6-metoxy-1,4-benzoquinol methylase